MVMSVKQSALLALASSGQAMTVQMTISGRAANQVKIPVKLSLRPFIKPQ